MLIHCLSAQINVYHLFKISTAAHVHVFESWTSPVNGCVSFALFNAVPNIYLQNWKAWVMQQTIFYNDVIMTQASGRKSKWAFKTNETDVILHQVDNSGWYECGVVQLHTYFSQGSAATKSRGGGNFNSIFFRRSSLNLTIKRLRKSVYICQNYHKNKVVYFLRHHF